MLQRGARQADFLPQNPAENHLDADTLAAFAENVLPSAARTNCMAHLADCNDCRAILSNLILLNEDAEAETVVANEKTVVVAKPSWFDSFKKVFAFPTLGYATALGALLLVATFAFITLRSSNNREAALVVPAETTQTETQTNKRPPAPAVERKDEEENQVAAEPSPTVEETPAETLAESSPTPDRSSENLPPSMRGTINQNNRNAAPSETSVARNNAGNTSSAPTNTAATPLPTPATSVSQPAENKADPNRAKTVKRDSDDEMANAEKPEDAKDKKNSAEELPAEAPSVSGSTAGSAKPAAPGARREIIATRIIGSKTFQKTGGVWIDKDYNSQNVTNVSRGSNEYKNLDARLRSIAESFVGETVVVVWQGKAYRIR